MHDLVRKSLFERNMPLLDIQTSLVLVAASDICRINTCKGLFYR